ncbi:MAG: dihydropteroate synthase [bacterium]|nr:dihydropteroate synthase [bacterium]
MEQLDAHHELVKDHVLLMGIVNVTPDSFSDGGTFLGLPSAIEHARKLACEGADIIDIGGESTRPGAKLVSIDEELSRVIPVIKGLKGKISAKISIDTRKADVMREAIKAGADIINDVTALQYDTESLHVAASSDCPVILMHGLTEQGGDPKTMQDNPVYEDVVGEVCESLRRNIAVCEGAGIGKMRLIIDPGIGFGKTADHNIELLANLGYFRDLGLPLLIGASRKGFIGLLGGESDAMKRAPGSIAAALYAVSQGAKILRVHDVAKTRQALGVWQALDQAKT